MLDSVILLNKNFFYKIRARSMVEYIIVTIKYELHKNFAFLFSKYLFRLALKFQETEFEVTFNEFRISFC